METLNPLHNVHHTHLRAAGCAASASECVKLPGDESVPEIEPIGKDVRLLDLVSQRKTNGRRQDRILAHFHAVFVWHLMCFA